MLYLSQRTQTILSKVLQIVVLAYQAVAILVFVSTLYLATDWLRNPFIGGFFEHTLFLNGSDTSEAGKSWAMCEQGFNVGDQLISVDGVKVSTSDQLKEILGSHKVGDQGLVSVTGNRAGFAPLGGMGRMTRFPVSAPSPARISIPSFATATSGAWVPADPPPVCGCTLSLPAAAGWAPGPPAVGAAPSLISRFQLGNPRDRTGERISCHYL